MHLRHPNQSISILPLVHTWIHRLLITAATHNFFQMDRMLSVSSTLAGTYGMLQFWNFALAKGLKKGGSSQRLCNLRLQFQCWRTLLLQVGLI